MLIFHDNAIILILIAKMQQIAKILHTKKLQINALLKIQLPMKLINIQKT